MEDWKLIYQVRWYAWIPLNLYGIIVELFMAVIGIGGLGYGIAGLFRFEDLPIDKSLPAWQAYGIFTIEMIFAAWLGWTGLRSAWAELLAIFTPPLLHEGKLDQLTDEIRHAKSTDYHVWVLKSGDKAWEIYKRDLDHAHASSQLQPGREIRVQYRRGTEQITQLWVRSKQERHHN